MADALDSKSSESNLMRVQVPPPVVVASVADALNLQMNREFFNARLYLSMAAFFESLNMPGAAKWMEVQAEEETGHAMRLYNHLRDRGARIPLEGLESSTGSS